jgi:peptide/nickel transport system permease protein
MTSFFLNRIFSGFLVVIGVVCIISSIIYLAPVDPARLTFGQMSEDRAVEQKRKELGLDKALHVQLLYYLQDISPVLVTFTDRDLRNIIAEKSFLGLRFILKKPNLRQSFQTGRDVREVIFEAIPQTAILALTALLLASIIGMFGGFVAALNKDSLLDKLIISLSTVGYSVPSYVSAILLAVVFGFFLSDMTHLNLQGSLFDINDAGEDVFVFKNLILPAIALGVRPIAVITQLTRSAVIDVLSHDYIKTAKSKGLSFIEILRKHVLKNSLNPIVTTISGWFASLLAGAFFVEFVFNFKGLGFTTVMALINYDIPVLLACMIFVSIAFVIINILVDLTYKMINPTVT